jgi:predicted metal-dependent hydrolase
MMSVDPDSEILLETLRIGASMEVRAVSGGDGLEVSFVVPAATRQADIQRLARQKLAYVRKKMRGGAPPTSDGRGGVVV